MSRFIVVVLDGFGIGEMPDVKTSRPQDIGANTAHKLLSAFSTKNLPTLGKLGLNNIVQCRCSAIPFSQSANTGKIQLKHEGCDTFAGHQELMGTKPKSPLVKPFFHAIDQVEKALVCDGYVVERIAREGAELLLVDGCVAVGDNLEAELGQVYNVTANFNHISFEALQVLGKVVRDNSYVARNVVFGGYLDSNQNLISAIEVKGQCIGINAPKSGAYDNGFQVVHLGYGVDHLVQAPEMLHQQNIKTTLVGKVADIVQNPHGISHDKIVDTDDVFSTSLKAIQSNSQGFFCINVQETDLSGHKQNPDLYWHTLERADLGLSKIIKLMADDDLLIVTADHGNDPYIGHSKHTREYVPLLVYKSGLHHRNVGERTTLADIGATACDFFSAQPPQYGSSFLPNLIEA